MGEKSKNLKETLVEALSLPKEIVLDLPKITIIGDIQIFIENYKGVVEYDSQRIRINTAKGQVKIFGENLEINTVTTEEIFITGEFTNIEFS